MSALYSWMLEWLHKRAGVAVRLLRSSDTEEAQTRRCTAVPLEQQGSDLAISQMLMWHFVHAGIQCHASSPAG